MQALREVNFLDFWFVIGEIDKYKLVVMKKNEVDFRFFLKSHGKEYSKLSKEFINKIIAFNFSIPLLFSGFRLT